MSVSSRVGWLALPAFLAVLTLIGLGLSTEGRSEFERRTADAGQGGFGEDVDPSGSGGSSGADAGDRGDRPRSGATPSAEPSDPDGGEPAQITVATETGDIIIQVDENGQPIRLTPVGPNGTGDAIDLDPEELVAIRLTEDGQLEVVPLGDIGPDDTVLVPADGGFDLRRPDGSVVEFRADGENDGITATEISPDGLATELEPNQDGSVTLSDGTTVGPIDFVDDPGPIERLVERTRELPWPWLVAGLVVLAAASIALALHLHRKRSDETFDFGQLSSADVPDDRFERFLESLLADPDPSRAIRIGFSVAERGLGGVPRRRVDETPFEWHRRSSEAAGQAGGSPVSDVLGTVCDLFARARFAPGESSVEDRRTMVDALRQLHRLGRSSSGHGPVDGSAARPDAQPQEV